MGANEQLLLSSPSHWVHGVMRGQGRSLKIDHHDSAACGNGKLNGCTYAYGTGQLCECVK